MKKLLIALLSFVALNVSAQKIILDSQEDGIRTISTDKENCRAKFSDRQVLSIGLSAFVHLEGGKQVLCLNAEVVSNNPIKVNKGGRCLIKLMDETVIELESSIESDGSVRDIQVINGQTFSNYKTLPSFHVTMEQLDQIAEKGVKKIKIETLPDNLENEYKKDKIGKAVKDRLPLLKKALESNKGFSDGF